MSSALDILSQRTNSEAVYANCQHYLQSYTTNYHTSQYQQVCEADGRADGHLQTTGKEAAHEGTLEKEGGRGEEMKENFVFTCIQGAAG